MKRAGRRSRGAQQARGERSRGKARQQWVRTAGAAVLVLAAAAAWFALDSRPTGEVPIGALPLSDMAQAGKPLFERYCADCHGSNGAGNDEGPPLVHRLYHPSHHGDAAFELAVRRGVRAHHWRFGDMPAQPSVTGTQVPEITRYVRELQKARRIY